MALSNLPDLSAPVGPAAELHLCLLDENGQVCATNYPVGDCAGVPLPELIRRAYGVAPTRTCLTPFTSAWSIV